MDLSAGKTRDDLSVLVAGFNVHNKIFSVLGLTSFCFNLGLFCSGIVIIKVGLFFKSEDRQSTLDISAGGTGSP